MGSGSGGGYSSSSSQPYAPSYHVESSMKQYDIDNGTYHNGRYDKNPTAVDLSKKINGDYIGDKSTNFKMPYVVDMNDNIIIGKRNGFGKNPDAPKTPHPTLIGGKDPQVKVAGILEVRKGKIYAYDNKSGHFRPNIKSLDAADNAFSRLPNSVFHKDFKKGKR